MACRTRLLAQASIAVLVAGAGLSAGGASAAPQRHRALKAAPFGHKRAYPKPRPRQPGRGGKTSTALGFTVLSGRADLVSGGDALVELRIPAAIDPATVRVTLAGRDVAGAFAVRADGRRIARLEGLSPGPNRLAASAGRARATVTLVDHPSGGPLVSGPQVTPWTCGAGTTGPRCDSTPRYELQYMPQNGRDFLPYDAGNPPANVATTTTDQGVSVPFVIRTEIGTADRDQYRITTLYQPGKAWEPWAPQPQFNHKLLITHGSGCGVEYAAGPAPSTTQDTALADRGLLQRSPAVALSRGWAVLSTALDNSGHNCNLVTQAESLVMAKERLVERYGELRFTVGMGCSGGSMAVQQVANAYPGVYDGLVPACSFPDAWSSATQWFDLHVLRRYLEDSQRWGPGVVWDPLSIGAVDGHPNHLSAILLDQLYLSGIGDPAHPCAGTTAATRWSPANRGGVRCTLADVAKGVLGTRPGDGYGGRPLDNVGVQYGLGALRSGRITPAQFADLNARVGGVDVDDVPTAERTRADEPALANAYRSGAIDDARQLDRVPIIDLRGSDEGILHDAYRSFAMRARLDLAHGTHANQVIWQGTVPSIGGFDFTTRGLLAMDRWLTAIERDTAPGSLPAKVLRDRPADVHDTCDVTTNAPTPPGGCPLIVRSYASPRIVAGDSVATLANKCSLKPLDRADYGVSFTAGQWAQLQAAFPTGVCDFGRAPVGSTPSVPWLSYADGPGGKPLP